MTSTFSDGVAASIRQRFHDAGGTGELTGANSRTYHSADVYDRLHRLTDEVSVGTNGGVARTRPDSVPGRSDTALVTCYEYDPATGWLRDVIDSKGNCTYRGRGVEGMGVRGCGLSRL